MFICFFSTLGRLKGLEKFDNVDHPKFIKLELNSHEGIYLGVPFTSSRIKCVLYINFIYLMILIRDDKCNIFFLFLLNFRRDNLLD